MGSIDVREKIVKTLGGFLERNREYAVGVCVSNGVSGNAISNFLVPIDRQYEPGEQAFCLKSNIGGVKSIGHIFVPYDEVLDCYEERDEYHQQMVYVILKNGMRIDFECVGLRV